MRVPALLFVLSFTVPFAVPAQSNGSAESLFMGASSGAGVALLVPILLQGPPIKPQPKRYQSSLLRDLATATVGAAAGLYLGATDAVRVNGAVEGSRLGLFIGFGTFGLMEVIGDPAANNAAFIGWGAFAGTVVGSVLGFALTDVPDPNQHALARRTFTIPFGFRF